MVYHLLLYKKTYFSLKMKFVTNTETKPVVGEQARRLHTAIEKGSFVSNERAQATAQRIFERFNKPKQS